MGLLLTALCTVQYVEAGDFPTSKWLLHTLKTAYLTRGTPVTPRRRLLYSHGYQFVAANAARDWAIICE